MSEIPNPNPQQAWEPSGRNNTGQRSPFPLTCEDSAGANAAASRRPWVVGID